MNYKTFQRTIGLSKNLVEQSEVNSFVNDAFSQTKIAFTKIELEKLYRFAVPKLGPNGACSITHEKEDKPYDLTKTYGIPFDDGLAERSETLRLWRLNNAVTALAKKLGCDWLGIYRKRKNALGEMVLVKEAYAGRFSRAEFPLTEEFAKGSNNATVGRSGKIVIVNEVAAYKGPYYECDADVQSECCCPILSRDGEILGIIDAESFTKSFFHKDQIAQITTVCFALGRQQEF